MRSKKCSKCNKRKLVKDFHKDSSKSDGFRSYCKKCNNEYTKIWRKNHRAICNEWYKDWYKRNKLDKIREYGLLSNYNITLEEYRKLLEGQNGVCKICGKSDSKALSVDHSHITGEIRGLLCQKCNSGLGMFNDSPELLNKAIEYLILNKTINKE